MGRRKKKQPTKVKRLERRLSALEWMLVKAHELNTEQAAEIMRLCGLWKPPPEARPPAPSDAGRPPPASPPSDVERCYAVDAKTGERCSEFLHHTWTHCYVTGGPLNGRVIPFTVETGNAVNQEPQGCTCHAVWIDANMGARSCNHSLACALMADMLPSGRAPEPPPHGDEHAPPWVAQQQLGINRTPAPAYLDQALGLPCVRCSVRFDMHSMDAGHGYEAPPLVGAGDLKTEVQPLSQESKS